MGNRTGLVKLRQRDSLRPLNIFITQGGGATTDFRIETSLQSGVYPCESTGGQGFSFVMEVTSVVNGEESPYTVEAPAWVTISQVGTTVSGTVTKNQTTTTRTGVVKVTQAGTGVKREYTVTQAECGVEYEFTTQSTHNVDATSHTITLGIVSKRGGSNIPYTYEGNIEGVVVSTVGSGTVQIPKNQTSVVREYNLYFLQEESNYLLPVTIYQEAEVLTYVFSLTESTMGVPCDGGEFALPVISTYTGNAGSSGVAELEITSSPEWVAEMQSEEGTKLRVERNG